MTLLAYPVVLASIITMLVAIGVTIAVIAFVFWVAVDFIWQIFIAPVFHKNDTEIDYDGYNPQVDNHAEK